MMHDLAEVNRL